MSSNGSATLAGGTQILVDGVSKTYTSRRGPVEALREIDFSLRRGEFLSLLGPSGCGKSTLLMIVSGLIPASSGSVTISGNVVKKPYTQVGIVFQRDVLLEWRNVLDNVMLQCEIRGLRGESYKRHALSLLSLVGLEGFTDRYPRELSGGMRQRVAICRALVHEPDLLLMDEPFGALDALTREQMNLDLLRLRTEQRTSVLFITHSISEAVMLSDRILVMSARPGQIVDELEMSFGPDRTAAITKTPEFSEHVQRIRDAFKAQGVLSDG